MLAASRGPSQFSCSPSSSSHPPILSIAAMAYENPASFWMALSKSNLSSTKDNQNCVTTNSLASLAIALNSALGQILPVLSSKRGFLFFSFRCTDWRNSAHLSSDHWPREQVPKHHPATTTETLSCGDTCHRVSQRARRRPGSR